MASKRKEEEPQNDRPLKKPRHGTSEEKTIHQVANDDKKTVLDKQVVKAFRLVKQWENKLEEIYDVQSKLSPAYNSYDEYNPTDPSYEPLPAPCSTAIALVKSMIECANTAVATTQVCSTSLCQIDGLNRTIQSCLFSPRDLELLHSCTASPNN
jgi:hypothetical protein